MVRILEYDHGILDLIRVLLPLVVGVLDAVNEPLHLGAERGPVVVLLCLDVDAIACLAQAAHRRQLPLAPVAQPRSLRVQGQFFSFVCGIHDRRQPMGLHFLRTRVPTNKSLHPKGAAKQELEGSNRCKSQPIGSRSGHEPAS